MIVLIKPLPLIHTDESAEDRAPARVSINTDAEHPDLQSAAFFWAQDTERNKIGLFLGSVQIPGSVFP